MVPAPLGRSKNWLFAALMSAFLLRPLPTPAEVKTIYACAITAGTSEELKDYVRSVLSTALDRTTPRFGPYEIRFLSDMQRKRIISELRHDGGPINSAILPLDASLNEALLPVRIPIDRGILGLRIMLVRAAARSPSTDLDGDRDLRTLRIGVSPNWIEARIIRFNGLNAVEGASTEALLKMLSVGRIDALDRSALEIGADFSRASADYSDIAVDRHFALYSPLPAYFWFANDEKGRSLAERVRIGLGSMVDDHSLDALFHRTFDPTLHWLKIEDRQIVHLVNPDIGPMDPIDDNRYWYVTTNAH